MGLIVRVLAIGLACVATIAAHAETLELQASRDNTLYESDGGTLSNGAGAHLFAGVTNADRLRRGLIAFDVAGAIPPGSTIDGVTLTLFMSRTSSGAHEVGVHRLLADWGEGTSQAPGNEGGGASPPSAGDATWLHTFHATGFWSSPGGDYSGIAGASIVVDGIGAYSWSSAGLASDVQGWIDDPASEFGWCLIGDEGASPGVSTSKRFDSRTEPTLEQRPRLTIEFTPPVTDGACCASDDACTVGDSAECDQFGGVFQGIGGDCTPNPCLDPTGGCCFPDGECLELSVASCSASGGQHQGDLTSCAPSTCPEPTGACCADSGLCSAETENDCAAIAGSYGGHGSDCASSVCPVVLEPFVDPLTVPPGLKPSSGAVGGAASYAIAATEFDQTLHRDLPATRVWGYDGSYPGPTIEAAAGEPVTVTWINDLRDEQGALRTGHLLPVDLCPHGPNHLGPTPRTVVHLHGAHVEAEFDGYPEDTILPGEHQVYVYGNDQLPATLWYHDHALGITRLNVYLGLAGFYLIRDPLEQSLGLPAGEYEIPLLIQDRTFAADGSLVYPAAWQDHFFGDTLLVNGTVWPYLEVARGKYRFRLLNGSGSRTYTLSTSNGMPLIQIGTDGGLLPAPVVVGEVTLGPAERADVILDFESLAPGTEVVLTNSAPAPYPGTPGVGVIPEVMKFIVGPETGHVAPVPGALRPLEPLDPGEAIVERDFELFRIPDACAGTIWSINGLRWDDITEYPELETVEIWRFINPTGIAHPMHMHLVMFQVLDRQPYVDDGGVPTPTGPAIAPAPEEAGWKDTVLAYPGEITRVIARFEDFTGKFAYHCHILEHEDNEMMRQFRTIACGNGVLEPTEVCDDGHRPSGDGCSSRCLPEVFAHLAGQPQGGVVQVDVDGVSFFAFTAAGQSAADVVRDLVDQINGDPTLVGRGIFARADGELLVVENGSLTVALITDDGLADRLSLRVASASLWWSEVQGGGRADIVRGTLSTLVGGAGDFATATQACLADDEPAATITAPSAPPPGEGYWYLVRKNGSGATYDSESPGQVGSRDPGIAASGVDCP